MQAMALQFGGSLIAVALLVLLVWRLGLGRPRPIRSETDARALAAQTIQGFAAVSIAIDRRGTNALLMDSEGRIVLIACHGAHFLIRQLGPASRARSEAGMLLLSLGEPGLAPAKIHLGEDAPIWERRIAALNDAEDA